ncbi:LD-carboxypeptidase [Arthrobacter sp. ISL-48]|uniref:S66 family peptidase n=1 Tax=Arthrobacter sp. ISL-48 TaxID=2819110 RepID=UPI001BE5D463|nr:S66 peptidase family protein [Arthrobacter sp. ISL-48]MBT2532940.1 LD-carboxypeptidase [Arthrobacter sp. ISL-48]
MNVTYPRKLMPGDLVRVIAPARSRAMVAEHDHSALIEQRFAQMGLRISYGSHVDERDSLDSSSIKSRVYDVHAAFADPQVAGILTVIGGFNSNELLPYLDWDLIAANPKILCGYSDITALQNAILAHTGLVTYSGPHWSSFGMRDHFEQTRQWFTETLLNNRGLDLKPSELWTDDDWFLDQDNRNPLAGDGWWSLQPGTASGRVVGGNLCTLNLLQGTPHMPALDGALLFLEDDYESHPATFARDLTSLLQVPDARGITGLVIGRFQRASQMTRDLLDQIVRTQPVLSGLPVLANADFGHTQPQITLPIGGRAELTVGPTNRIRIAAD